MAATQDPVVVCVSFFYTGVQNKAAFFFPKMTDKTKKAEAIWFDTTSKKSIRSFLPREFFFSLLPFTWVTIIYALLTASD